MIIKTYNYKLIINLEYFKFLLKVQRYYLHLSSVVYSKIAVYLPCTHIASSPLVGSF
jgi:hypothetical protein